MADTLKPSANAVPARVCRWFGGKKAALSLRFDDSHPTHIEVALPLLNERGLIGTFLVNPGKDAYRKYREVWEGAVLARGHELADHTMNHRGAKTDAEADQEIGAAADLLHRLQPGHRQIMFEPGGATLWLQRKPFAFFDAKYHLYDVNDQAHRGRNVMSCSEVYRSFSVDAFRRKLEGVIAQGDWFQPHFHQIDSTGHLRITPPVFRQVLDVVAGHRADLWQAGMTAIHEYEEERNNAAVWAVAQGDDALVLDLTCGTDPNLYDQPLTLEVDLPASAASASVSDTAGKLVASRIEEAHGQRLLRFEALPVDARFVVRAPGLGSASRSRIPEVRAPGAHPYVLFRAADVPALLARNADPLANRMWEHILRRADSIAARSAADEPRDAQPWVRMGQELSPIDSLGLAYALTGNRGYATAAAPRLEALAGEDWWYEQNSEMLITSSALLTMGLAYDWMHDALTESQRRVIRAAMVEHGFKPIVAATESGAWWTNWYHCNWGSVIYGEAGVAALALLDEEPGAADWIRLSQRKIWHYLHSLSEDGSWGESATYGAFAWSNAILFADALRRVAGYDPSAALRAGLFDSPRLRKLPEWFITLLEPGGANFVPFSNCQRGSSSAAAILFRLAHEYGDGHAQLVAQQMSGRRGGSDLFSYLWYDPTVAPEPLADLPLDTVFSDIDWAFLRSSREDAEATLFALKGGHKEWDHSHHDTNSFVLYAHGRPLIIDLFYPHQIWGVKTEAHNTVMVDGREQSGHVNVAGGRDDPNHRGVVSDLIDTPWYARVIGDASLAYDPDNLTSFVREVMYLRHAAPADPPDYFVMLDDVETPSTSLRAGPAQSHIDWLLHTYGDAKLSGNALTITQDQAAVDVTLLSPEKFSCEVTEKSFEETDVPRPFDGAQSIKTIKFAPAKPASRVFFLSVLSPRAASAAPAAAIEPIRQANVVGAAVVSGSVQDLAMFALDQPEMAAEGVEAVGRSCFVRTSNGRLVGAALHKGQRLFVGGVLVFETNSAGHAVLTFGDDGVQARLDLYDSNQVRIHVDRAPVKVLVDGKERPFEYEEQLRCVKLGHFNTHEVSIRYQ